MCHFMWYPHPKLSFSGNFLIHLNKLPFLFKYLYIVYLCELDNKLIYFPCWLIKYVLFMTYMYILELLND